MRISRQGRTVLFAVLAFLLVAGVQGEEPGEVLAFRPLKIKHKEGELFNPREPGNADARTPDECVAKLANRLQSRTQGQLAEARKKEWVQELGVDFEKEMLIASFKGQCATVCGLSVKEVRVVEGAVRVDLEFKEGHQEALSYPYALVAIPRKELPVVFFENGQPLPAAGVRPAPEPRKGAAAENPLEAFTRAAKSARWVAVGTLSNVQSISTMDQPPSIVSDSGEFKAERMLRGSLLKETITVTTGNRIIDRGKWDLRPGLAEGKVLVCLPENLPGETNAGPLPVIPWSQKTEDDVVTLLKQK